jgi:hypothetical protein
MMMMMIIIIIIIINCNWAYARWQCYKNWRYIQEMDIHSKETKHTSHEETASHRKKHISLKHHIIIILIIIIIIY